MNNKRRSRTDGERGLQEIVAGASLPPDSPPNGINLTDIQLKWWETLYQSKARRAWRKQDLLALADACRVRSQIEEMRGSLLSVDPIHDITVYDKLSKLIDLSVKQYRLLCVYLQIHPEATQGKSHKQVEQNKIHDQAAGNIEDQSDGLIPRPTSH